MTNDLSTLQQTFSVSAAHLILKAVSLGYGVTLGEAWRSPQEAQRDADSGKGISHSLHTQRLAIDINLFQDGEYQADDAKGCYTIMGDWWKSQGANYFWGGDFTSRDYDHFSLSPNAGETK
jgi:hypothetical protein